jgi:hypothetical protein
MATRVANLQLMNVNPVTGEVYQRGAPQGSLPIKAALSFETQQRIIEDADLPNTAGFPTLENYLQLEAGDGFRPVQVDQTFVITIDAEFAP